MARDIKIIISVTKDRLDYFLEHLALQFTCFRGVDKKPREVKIKMTKACDGWVLRFKLPKKEEIKFEKFISGIRSGWPGILSSE